MDANHLFGPLRIIRNEVAQLRSLHDWRDRGDLDEEPWEQFGGQQETALRLDALDEAVTSLQRELRAVAGRC